MRLFSMVQKTLGQKEGETMDNVCFDIVTQMEKKADFLYRAVDTYIQDAESTNRSGLVQVWNTIKEDEKKHFDMLKQELAREVREGRL
jgi:rubrerythrin